MFATGLRRERESRSSPAARTSASAFSRLPFDHLLFTGATSIAYHVMSAAAENLVPTTLELGGKSPVIVGDSADMELTAKRVMMGKTMNAGQICLAPDYVMVPKDKRRRIRQRRRRSAVTHDVPDIEGQSRLHLGDQPAPFRPAAWAIIDDAKAKGAEIVEINPAKRRFPPAALSTRSRRRWCSIPPTT